MHFTTEKPRCELSLDLLAKLIGCSRNQLLYQQKQIHSSYTGQNPATYAKVRSAQTS